MCSEGIQSNEALAQHVRDIFLSETGPFEEAMKKFAQCYDVQGSSMRELFDNLYPVLPAGQIEPLKASVFTLISRL